MSQVKKYVKPAVTSKKIKARLSSRRQTMYGAIEDLLISDVYANTVFIPLIMSDRNSKTNIIRVKNVLQSLATINAFSFSYRSSKSSKSIGVMAQEVAKKYPQLVGNIPNSPYKGVNYSGLTALLVEAVKELHKQNHELRSHLTKLEKKMNTLSA